MKERDFSAYWNGKEYVIRPAGTFDIWATAATLDEASERIQQMAKAFRIEEDSVMEEVGRMVGDGDHLYRAVIEDWVKLGGDEEAADKLAQQYAQDRRYLRAVMADAIARICEVDEDEADDEEKDAYSSRDENLSDNQRQFVRDAQEQGLHISAYSGRGMEGKCCPAVRVEHEGDFKTTSSYYRDALGLGMVLYARF